MSVAEQASASLAPPARKPLVLALGAFFVIWDRIFGTRNDDGGGRYPDTGITDPIFPHSTSRSPIALVRTWGAQFAYPFRATAARRESSVNSSRLEPLSSSW